MSKDTTIVRLTPATSDSVVPIALLTIIIEFDEAVYFKDTNASPKLSSTHAGLFVPTERTPVLSRARRAVSAAT